MWRSVLIFATLLPIIALGVFRLVAAGDTQAAANSSAEAREALAQAKGEAARAGERAGALDRQARAALAASDRASLAAAALAARVQQSEAALAAAQAELGLVRAARARLASQLASESAPIARLMAALQTQVRRPAALQLLQPGSISNAVHVRAILVGIEAQIISRTAELREELARHRSLERKVARMADRQHALQNGLRARRGELADLAAAQRLKARRASSAADREAERAFALAQKARSLPALVTGLEANARVATSMYSRSERAIQPSATDPFAPRRLPVAGRPAAMQSSGRKGLTLAPRPDALVVAPAGGRVTFAGPYRGYGTIVIMEHPEGWTSVITGLAGAEVAVGQKIATGHPLGQAPARNPLITLELRRNGVPVDPAPLLR